MDAATILITSPDHSRLTRLVEARRAKRGSPDEQAFERLAGELARAQLVASHDIPHDVVTMNSRVHARDLDSGEVLDVTLAWPTEADASQGRINVLAPLGMALLGCRVGQTIEWPVPDGRRRLAIENVLFQPERGTNGNILPKEN